MPATTVLVVEDDARVASGIADQLREEDYDVHVARSAREAGSLLATRSPHAAVLDVMLPDGSGFDLCRRVRRGGGDWDPSLAILMLTARGDEADVLRAFERGADDYLRKPFSMPELVARLRALLARRRRAPAPVLHVGELVVDVAAGVASYGGRRLELPGKEFALLAELASEPGALRTKQELLARVWEWPGSVQTRTVDSHASRLRRKLVAAGAPGDPVVNSWGRGYRLELGRA
jgi:two-component system phosphate regulon response regulator PhoB